MILMLCERAGCWPLLLHLVIVVLIPKMGGGSRPISLFMSIIRLWSRARSPLLRQWEQDNERKQVFGGAGRSATQSAWLAGFSAEMAAACGMRRLHDLLDITKAFERVIRGKLLDAALKHHFPMRILLLSLESYAMPRALKLRGVVSPLVYAVLGVAAGSGSATSELRCLLLDVVDEVTTAHPDSTSVFSSTTSASRRMTRRLPTTPTLKEGLLSVANWP